MGEDDWRDKYYKINFNLDKNDLYKIDNICQNYIVLIVKVLFNEFNNLFDLLATHLKSSKTVSYCL